MSELFWNTITPDMLRILGGFPQSEPGAKFYLAGGTALSLQIGHRISGDLDFFSQTEDIPTLRPALEKALASFHPILADSAWGNLVYLAQNVRTDTATTWSPRLWKPLSHKDQRYTHCGLPP